MALEVDKVREIADRVAASSGLEVVEVELRGGGKARARLDAPTGAGFRAPSACGHHRFVIEVQSCMRRRVRAASSSTVIEVRVLQPSLLVMASSAAVLIEFPDTIVSEDGTPYLAKACGRAESSGLWQAWIEFLPVHGGEPIRSPRETTQPNSRGSTR